MKIEVLYFNGCPNYLPAVERLRAVLSQEGLSLAVELIEVKDEAMAKELRFVGSPTIRVNGLDIEPDARGATAIGFACRLYKGGLPPEEMIRAAHREARKE